MYRFVDFIHAITITNIKIKIIFYLSNFLLFVFLVLIRDQRCGWIPICLTACVLHVFCEKLTFGTLNFLLFVFLVLIREVK
jgi:hypothetical protein